MSVHTPDCCLLQVITLPRSNIGDSYYLSKLDNYNLTVWEHGSKQGICYLWHEGEMGRGSSDIATAVCRWLEAKDAEGMKEVIFYSDAPASQNRNKYFVSMVIHFLTRAQSITEIMHKVSTFQSLNC